MKLAVNIPCMVVLSEDLEPWGVNLEQWFG
jgi:hypothetical protein